MNEYVLIRVQIDGCKYTPFEMITCGFKAKCGIQKNRT